MAIGRKVTGAFLRRLYSTFAGGWPGIGLLLMRSVIGIVLMMRAGSRLWGDTPISVTFVSILLIGAGALLIAGLWTPIVGTAVAIIEIWKVVALSGDTLVWLLLATSGAALAMLGPGLWSVDARLFGWKRVEPARRRHNSISA